MKKILIIQTAFIGDVILTTGLLESLRKAYPDATIDFVLRRGNENLIAKHPGIGKVLIWDKKNSKLFSLLKLILQIRKQRYQLAINVQRFFSTGLIMLLTKADEKRGFDKNPLSFFYDKKIKHRIGNMHETERNFMLLQGLNHIHYHKPQLFLPELVTEKIRDFQQNEYVCLAPASVWFTKQLPMAKWVELILSLDQKLKVYLIGANSDYALCNEIRILAQHPNVEILCGKLSLTESAALMKGARMNYVNDSAPLHLASAVNAPVTAYFCSTSPSFGFGPLSTISVIKEVNGLACKPCGLHGYRQCPLHHFNCGYQMEI
jgi:heptosyltransferase-2